ncbi:ShlB/FhaC/HecB family hemolysin secretion/activation protein [Herminiimonas arsenitoxidans]|uniref:ShlB/FhaC/HecB family hemolysin secretion/activation protein n=1 Tax=Herminiimonas arsenitoxidans TaxID=1809410 RepID=UPI00156D83F2|nr:ShlB/FhaC/HecB family hemolysin secretion/activation protein [Herminiimonas arsenitoxidans]
MQCLLGVTLTLAAAGALADDRFNITRFQIDGNTLLPTSEVQALTAPLSGPNRAYGDVQKALEALQNAYRKAGYSTVQVYVPEQELTSGVVKIQVNESVIGKVVVSGNNYFSEQNIRRSLPQVQSGKTPNLRQISEAVQLSNDSPAKQINVVLGTSEEDGKIDAEVKVSDNNPLRVFMTLDNTGTDATGKWRTGVAIQHANLFDRDQVGTLAYTTSPDSPSGVRVNLYSLGYRIPLYGMGDSLDFIYGKSSVNTPGASPTLGGLLGFTGKGDIFGLRWNHFFARQGETSTKLVFGLDYKKIDSRCNINGIELSTAPPTPPVASCVPYTTMPLSATYSGQTRGVSQNIDYNVGIARNIGTGTAYTNNITDGRTDRYSYLTPGSRNTNDNFIILRGGASIFKSFSNDWQMRVAGSAQYAKDPLVSAEQFGLAGATMVRGFTERAVAADSGMILNSEIYTPELLSKGNLRLLAFYDIGRGYNNKVGSTGIPSSMTVASIGVGARYVLGRDFNLRLDVARVQNAGTAITESRGDVNAHLSATLGF